MEPKLKKEAYASPKTEAKAKALKAKKAGQKEVHSHTHTHTQDPVITHFLMTQNTESLEAASEEHL